MSETVSDVLVELEDAPDIEYTYRAWLARALSGSDEDRAAVQAEFSAYMAPRRLKVPVKGNEAAIRAISRAMWPDLHDNEGS